MCENMENFKSENGKYYIDGKKVSQKTYTSMLEEYLETAKESLEKANNQNRIYPSIPHQTENNCNEEFCKHCQATLDFIKYLSQIEPENALEIFNGMIEQHRQESYMSGMIEAYNNLGSIGYKIASKIENDLEEMLCEFEND